MAKQQEIIAILKAFFRDDAEQIRAVALIGSFGRGQGSSSSDIDFELLLPEEALDIDQFTKDIVHLFVNRADDLVVKHTLWLAEEHKLALYHGRQLLLTEIYLYHELSQFDKYFLGSRITDLDRCILVDRDSQLRPHLEHILSLPYDDRPGLIRELVGQVQFLLESASSAARRSDGYKFYFLSNIALHQLVRLSYVLDGKMEYNYNPPGSLVDSHLASSMDLQASGSHVKKLVDSFLEQLTRVAKTDETISSRARCFCADLLQRDSQELVAVDTSPA